MSNIWRKFEMPLINCELRDSSVYYDVWKVDRATKITIDTKLYISVVTQSTQDNSKL